MWKRRSPLRKSPLTTVLVLTFIYTRAGRLNWLLEVGPALLGILALALTYRRLPLSDFCYFLVLSVVMASAAVYELIEWWTTYLVASDGGQAFLGSQGEPWDTQWDMFLALIGASVGLLLLGRLHDRSMEKLIKD